MTFCGRVSFACFSKNSCFPHENATWESMRLLGAKYMETFGCMSMPFGCMSMDRLGACMRLLGAKSAAMFGCMPDSR